MAFLFGCQQCQPPAGTDLATLATGIWALLTALVVILAISVHDRPR